MKPRIFTCALAALAFGATAAMAGGWPNIPVKKPAARSHDHATAQCCSARAQIAADARKEVVGVDGFEFVGGEPGWQLAQHKYDVGAGPLAHAADCPVTLARIKAEEQLGGPTS